MIDLFYWPTPNGWKIAIALEEMGLPYRVNLVDIGHGDQFAPRFLSVAPNNKIPAIIDQNGPGNAPISIFESGAILMYLANKTGKFYGETTRERIEVDQWLMWQMGGVGPMAGQAHHFLKYAPQMDPPHNIPYAKERYAREVSRLYKVLDQQLTHNPYVAGDAFTIADMAIWPWASLWEGQQHDITTTPHLRRWLDTVGAREGVMRGRALAAEKRTETLNEKAAETLFKR